MNEKLLNIAQQFAIEGDILSIEPLGEGFINDTYVVKTAGSAPDYILQRKNHNVFPDVPGMMDNILAVTEHIKCKVADPMRETLTVIRSKDGKLYVESEGNFWAVCIFIPDTATYDRADSPELAYQGGLGIGRFQALLSDFDKPLNETIKGFHNIRWRFEQWDAMLKADPMGRVKELATEIEWIESRREQMMNFWALVEDGTIPTHVTHNDTKISNILFDVPRLCRGLPLGAARDDERKRAGVAGVLGNLHHLRAGAALPDGLYGWREVLEDRLHGSHADAHPRPV